MERYSNRSGNSPLTHFQIEDDRITVWFSGTAKSYTYSYRKAGQMHVERIKVLAMGKKVTKAMTATAGKTNQNPRAVSLPTLEDIIIPPLFIKKRSLLCKGRHFLCLNY